MLQNPNIYQGMTAAQIAELDAQLEAIDWLRAAIAADRAIPAEDV